MNNLRTYLILFGGVFALSTSAIWVRLAGAPSGVTAFYRLAITAVVLLPFFLLSKSGGQGFAPGPMDTNCGGGGIFGTALPTVV